MVLSMVLCYDSVYANYIGPSVMTDAYCEGFPICDNRITENDRCVINIIGIHCMTSTITHHRAQGVGEIRVTLGELSFQMVTSPAKL